MKTIKEIETLLKTAGLCMWKYQLSVSHKTHAYAVTADPSGHDVNQEWLWSDVCDTKLLDAYNKAFNNWVKDIRYAE